MMADGVFQASEGTIVEKGWLQSGVTQRRGAKLIPVLGQPSHLFQAKVFVGSWTIEGNILNSRRDLRHADHVLFEIAEHLKADGHDRLAHDLSNDLGAFRVWLQRCR